MSESPLARARPNGSARANRSNRLARLVLTRHSVPVRLHIAPRYRPVYIRLVAPDPCPSDPESVAEEYCLGRLPHSEMAAFEGHCADCPTCYAVLRREQLTVGIMRAADRARNWREPESK